jgi:hypothetical protein
LPSTALFVNKPRLFPNYPAINYLTKAPATSTTASQPR